MFNRSAGRLVYLNSTAKLLSTYPLFISVFSKRYFLLSKWMLLVVKVKHCQEIAYTLNRGYFSQKHKTEDVGYGT
jgi:hypothetical protein